jgi:trimethylamine--corrinoid protein Co-methyltransferase
MRTEYFSGNGVSDQNSRENWEQKGGQDARARAREIAKNILATEEKSYISSEIEQAIREKYKIMI